MDNRTFVAICLSLVALIWTAPASQSQSPSPVIGPQDAIGFDYADADFQQYAVERFEAQYDGGAWASIGIPQVAGQSNGLTTYRVIPPMPSGNHTVGLRACNAVGCSTSSSPFAFAVLGAPETAPGNVRKIPRG